MELDFSNPVSITAGTTYVASYHTTTGHYAVTSGGLSSAVTNGPLTALANGGVYAYGSSTTFPSSTFGGSNYWVDVVYQQQTDTSPPTVNATTPGNSATSVPVSSSVTATFNKAIKSGSATFSLTGPGGNAVAGTTSLNSSGTVLTFTPSSALSQGTDVPGERQRCDQHVRCHDDISGHLVVHHFRVHGMPVHDLGERRHAG